MDKDEKDLKHLIEELPIKSKAARLRSLLPVIDQRLRDGVSQEDILQLLQSNGLSINIHTFRSHLYRYRKFLTPTSLKPNGNLSLENCVEPQLEADQPKVTDMLDARKRDEFSEKYLDRKPSIFNKE